MAARSLLTGFLLMLFSQASLAQLCFPVKKAYAYFQPVTAGVMSKDEAKNRQQKGDYLIYITSKSEGISVKNIWINGELYNGSLLPVNTPVKRSTGNNALLVPANKNKTYRVSFTALNTTGVKPVLPKKYISTPVVLELQYKQRKKFVTLDTIQQLDVMPRY